MAINNTSGENEHFHLQDPTILHNVFFHTTAPQPNTTLHLIPTTSFTFTSEGGEHIKLKYKFVAS